ncbi:MAG: VCBS repeat-containing protein [Planctomycetota bacterium]
MDVNGDGKMDVLSGSYSRMDKDMAGLFQVLWGEGEGKYKKAEPLNGTDGAPLIIPLDPAQEDNIIVRICTRPTAVDFDGDGDLDIVSGNFEGTFYLFAGEGGGKFAPVATPLLDTKGAALQVEMHSDPFFVDWDGDGDLDLLSGSATGGVYLAKNVGTRSAPAFERFQTLIEHAGQHGGQNNVSVDDSHIKVPQSATRIWVDDVNGDGKGDLLVGDTVTLITPAEGVSLEDATAKYAALMERQMEIFGAPPKDFDSLSEEEQQKFYDEQSAKYEAFEAEVSKVVQRESTGFVWVYHRK